MDTPSLRYSDLIGQSEAIARLKGFTEFFSSQGSIPDHILLLGDDGMGKRTIAQTVANELKARFIETDPDKLQIVGDFTSLVTNFKAADVCFLPNFHRLRKIHLDRLPEVMREGKLQIEIGQGPAARVHVFDLVPFTLVATCRRRSDCPPELLGLFSLVVTLQPYSRLELCAIAENVAGRSGCLLEPEAAALVAGASDGLPRTIAATLDKLVRATGKTNLSGEDVRRVFVAFGIATGLDSVPNTPDGMDDMSGQDFERLILALLVQMGFQAELTKISGDGGIDIVARLDRPIVGGRYLFQCKRFAPDNLVGAPTVRAFYGAVMADHAVKGVFVTTSDFTVQAREFAEKVGMELISQSQLRQLLVEHGLYGVQPCDVSQF